MADEEMLDDQLDEIEEVETRDIGARPGTDTNIVIQLLIGLMGTVIVSFGLYPLHDTNFKYIYQIINERGPVQYAELFMSFMVAAMVFLKTRIVRNQLRVIAEGPVGPDVDLNDDEQITNLRRDIRHGDGAGWSIVLNRIDRLLALWLGSKDIARVASWAGAESQRDSSASDSSYSNARVLIWAIPILGFIGTVLGLGSAVSGFSEFLAGAADLSSIKEAIGGVTSGLGTAFDTTLLALVLSVFLMFPLSSVQRKEETLFVEIDNYLDDTLISRLPSAEQQPIVIENLEDSIEAAFRRYIPDPDRYDEVFTRSIDKAASTVEQRFSGLAQSYEATLTDLTGRLSKSLSSVGTSMEKAMQEAMDDMRKQDEQLLVSRKSIAEEESNRLRSLLQEVSDSALKISNEYKSSADELQSVTRESMEKSQGAARDLATRMAEVASMAANIDEMLQVEQAVQKGLQSMAATDDFQRTLTDLRQHLQTTDAFCDKLSQPRVITLQEEII